MTLTLERDTVPHFVYLLHFREKLSHAEHYSGCTANLYTRLRRHAIGQGSALMRALIKNGIEWDLAACWVTSGGNLRYFAERGLKDSHRQARYCPVCRPDGSQSLPGTLYSYDTTLLQFPTYSRMLREQMDYAGDQDCMTRAAFVRRADGIPEDDMRREEITRAIRQIMHKDKGALGHIPAGGSEGLAALIRAGRVYVAMIGRVVAGYLIFTHRGPGDSPTARENVERVTIAQLAVMDEFRFQGIGAGLVTYLRGEYPKAELNCRVRKDLPANGFWGRIGFEKVADEQNRQGSYLNRYILFNGRGAYAEL